MTRALLVDLDDTLLENDVGRFIAAYFDLLAGDLSAFGPKEEVLRAILGGTKAMLASNDPQRSLADVFYDSFLGATGAAHADVAPVVSTFYARTYPRLAYLTQPKPGAAELLDAARTKGLDLAVATNPLMVRSSIEFRLAWAGVPVGTFDYALITDVETFHFAKPRLSYYAEALGRLGLLPGEAAMVGNDPTEDLAPAAALGLAVFHVSDTPQHGMAGGSLREAARWLQTDPAGDPIAANRPESLIARMEGQLAALLTKIRQLGEDGLLRAEGEDGLAPLLVICHLRDVDREINLPRLQAFLENDNPFLSSVDTHEWIQQRAYDRENPETAVRGYIAARQEVLESLRDLSLEQWDRRARHSLFGPITLSEWIAVLAEHDLRHAAKIRFEPRSAAQVEAVWSEAPIQDRSHRPSERE